MPRPRPRRRKARTFFAQLGLAVLIGLLLLQVVPHHTIHTTHPTSQGAGTIQPTTGTGQATSPGRITQQPTATSTGSPTTSAQVAATFLTAYFSWKAADTDNAYNGRWLALVAPEARRDLLIAAPRLILDNGADSAASSPRPALASSSIQQGAGQFTWTIQVLPAGGEQVAWQPRLIHATLTLTKTATGWQVASVSWTSTEGGNG